MVDKTESRTKRKVVVKRKETAFALNAYPSSDSAVNKENPLLENRPFTHAFMGTRNKRSYLQLPI